MLALPPLESDVDDNNDPSPPFPTLSPSPSLSPTVAEGSEVPRNLPILPSAIATNTTNKRSAPPLTNNRLTKRDKNTRGEMAKKVTFSPAMTAQIMVWMRDCKDEALFNSSKWRDYGPAWDVILGHCQRAWPHLLWTKKTVAAKYDTEKRRYQAFKMLLEGFSGVTYNYETGFPEAAETTWEAFLRKNNTKHRDFGWLRRVPLSDREVYDVVFWRERATGFDIAEAGDLAMVATTPRPDDDDNSGRDNAELSDTDDDDIAGDIFEAASATESSSTVSSLFVIPTPPLRLTGA